MIPAVLSTGCGFTEHTDASVPGEVIADRALTAAIRQKLGKEANTTRIIRVETSHGNVTLTGIVGSRVEGDRVIESVLSVDGVKSVSPILAVRAMPRTALAGNRRR